MNHNNFVALAVAVIFTASNLNLICGFVVGFGSVGSEIVNIKSPYDQYASSYDDLDGGMLAKRLGLDSMRRKVGEYADGKVLETAIGTGLQLPYYHWANIHEFVGIDLSQGMLNKATEKISELEFSDQKKVQIKQGDVSKLSLLFPTTRKFDSIVDTFSMCVFEDPEQVVSEMKKVLSPTGKIILLENSRSTNPLFGWFQDVSSNLIATSSKGCRWNVNVPKITEKLGLTPVYSEDQLLGTLHLGVYISQPTDR